MIDLHERIAAAVAEMRAEWDGGTTQVGRFYLAACDYTDKVLARHKPAGARVDYCQSGDGYWPCPDILALAEFWLGPGWEDQ